MRTSELTGAALDWAVAMCERVSVEYVDDSITRCLLIKPLGSGIFSPSTDWAQGGSIIEREKIDLMSGGTHWTVCMNNDSMYDPEIPLISYQAENPLVAAMRCYVASKLGDEVEIPEELK